MELSVGQRLEIAAWIAANVALVPEPVRIFLVLHQKYLGATGDARAPFDSAWRELRRALRITPSSERRPSGAPLSAIPREAGGGLQSEREKLEEQLGRTVRLSDWHRGLDDKHGRKAKRLQEKLAKMATEQDDDEVDDITEATPVEEIELTAEEIAAAKAYAEQFGQRMLLGDGADPALMSVNETLMPGGAVLASVERESLPAVVPDELAGAEVVKTLTEQRVRYDFAVAVTRIELDVEKKVVVEEDGERHVITASTREYGPPRFSVTWSALATLAVMVGQFALPFNRLATMFSTQAKRFTAASLSRMLRYVAQRLVPIYLQLAKELADSAVLAGDDTSCRVLEVSMHFAKKRAEPASAGKAKPPWADYRTPDAAELAHRRCDEVRRERIRRREDGDRGATPSPEETPSLGVLIGRHLAFESPRRNGNGPKESMNTTVVSGRAVAEEPRSLIVFYRSHLGGCGNLFEHILANRSPAAKRVTLQGDLSPTNLVTSPELLGRFKVRHIGCTSHARRPFANYEHEDPVSCSHMLHLFLGLAIHEKRLDVHGRNRENVLAVRGNDSRELWDKILELARTMVARWPPASKLGAGARYIVNHFQKLTAYLDDPRLEATNNLRERMLRTEKLIEGSSMFRRSLEGRFALDVVRSTLQTAVAAGVPVHEYVLSVLRANEEDVALHPERYTPRAWAASRLAAAAADNIPSKA
jgi:hypothetical protein